MASFVASLPLQLLCQLIASNSSSNISQIGTMTIEQLQQQIDSTTGAPSVKHLLLPPGYVAYPEIGVAFKVHSETATFRKAENQCRKEGGRLAIIDSLDKLKYTLFLSESLGEVLRVGLLDVFGQERNSIGARSYFGLSRNDQTIDGDLCIAIKPGPNELGKYDCDDEKDFICELPISQEN
ncbi:uncharacterized protein [Neodiprion pinetum]|uniref:uncharacterized protein n=1 Tax=Neodiprion pinetum TaxID=441929 RepID=UPI001EDE554D|nr:uncharacterized protein LOC124223599 [Neodiprion pinetum]